MDRSGIDVEPRMKQMMRPLSIMLQLYLMVKSGSGYPPAWCRPHSPGSDSSPTTIDHYEITRAMENREA